MNELGFTSAVELARLIRERQLSAVEVAETFLRHIDAENSTTNSFVTITHDLAMETARRRDDDARRGGPLGVLHGVPVAIKDLFDLRSGTRSTFGSLPLRDFVASETTLYVQRLEDAGAVIVGKTNAPEFGHKGVTDNLVTGPTRNPFDLTRNSGGSSGGAAAAVAAGLVPLAQGTDGGGSVRIPAAWCGVFGMKPSFGRIADISRPDAFISSSPFISAGPIARSVSDGALMLAAMAGPHSRDPFSLPDQQEDFSKVHPDGLRGRRVAFSPDLGGFPVDADVASTVRDSIQALTAAGAIVDQVEMRLPAPQLELSELWVRLMGVLYSDSLAAVSGWGVELMDHLEELTPAFRDMLVEAHTYSALDVRRDERLRSAVYDAVEDVFDGYDFLVSPTLATSPVLNATDGSTTGPAQINGVEVNPSIGWCLTYPFNFTGHPAASVPCGLTSHGLPVGLQIVAPRHADGALLAACAAMEESAPWMDTYPRR